MPLKETKQAGPMLQVKPPRLPNPATVRDEIIQIETVESV
jgi:hypothetical protein